MGYIVSCLFAIIGMFFHRREETWSNPASLMCYLWTVVSFAASLRLFGLYDVSMITWMIIFVGVLSFCVGTRFCVVINSKREYFLKKQIEYDSFISPRLFWIMVIILCVLIVSSLNTTFELMNRGYRLDEIRQAILGIQKIDGYIFKNSTFSYYMRYLQSAMQTILTAVGIELFFIKPQKNIRYLIAVLFIAVADSFSNGGRWVIMYTAVEFFVGYTVIKKRKSSIGISGSHKIKIYLIIVAIALTVAMDQITSSRLGGGFIQHFYLYLCGCVPFLDCKIGFLEDNNYYTLFFTGQYGIWSFIVPYIEKIVGKYGTLYTNAMDIIGNTQFYEYIGNNQTYNAFVSAFYYLYADLRWIGVVLGMLIFGIIAGTFFKRSVAENDGTVGKISFVVPYLVIAQMIIKSIQSYPLAANSYVVTILLLVTIFFVRNRAYIKT